MATNKMLLIPVYARDFLPLHVSMYMSWPFNYLPLIGEENESRLYCEVLGEDSVRLWGDSCHVPHCGKPRNARETHCLPFYKHHYWTNRSIFINA